MIMSLFSAMKIQNKFASINNIDRITYPSDSTIFVISFTKDQASLQYEREVFSFLDLIGNLGGVFGIISPLCAVFVHILAEKMFNYSVLTHLYQVDTIVCQKDHWISDNSTRQNRRVTPVNFYSREENKIHTSINGINNENEDEVPSMSRRLNQISSFSFKSNLVEKAMK